MRYYAATCYTCDKEFGTKWGRNTKPATPAARNSVTQDVTGLIASLRYYAATCYTCDKIAAKAEREAAINGGSKMVGNKPGEARHICRYAECSYVAQPGSAAHLKMARHLFDFHSSQAISATCSSYCGYRATPSEGRYPPEQIARIAAGRSIDSVLQFS